MLLTFASVVLFVPVHVVNLMRSWAGRFDYPFWCAVALFVEGVVFRVCGQWIECLHGLVERVLVNSFAVLQPNSLLLVGNESVGSGTWRSIDFKSSTIRNSTRQAHWKSQSGCDKSQAF